MGDCPAVRTRLISRALTNLYDGALAGHGVTIAQLNLPASTVSRNLNLLLGHSWIEAVSADAKGIREVALTDAGQLKIESALPAWRKCQEQAAHLLGATGTGAIHEIARGMGYPPGS